MYIFGGFNGKRFLNDLHVFHLVRHEMMEIKSMSGDIPRGVRSHSLVWNLSARPYSLVLFAGRDDRDNDNNDLLELNLGIYIDRQTDRHAHSVSLA